MQITEKQYTLITKLYTSMRVCTHQRSPVQSKPVQSHSRRCGLLTIAAAAVRTHQQRELSPMSLAKSRVLMTHVLFSSVKTPVIGHDGRNGGREDYSFR